MQTARYRPPQDPEDDFEALLRQAWGTRVKVDMVMALLGLAHCAETPCGDQLTRGISGGERKRLTTAEMLVRGEEGLGRAVLGGDGCRLRASGSIRQRCWWCMAGKGGGSVPGRVSGVN